MSRYLSFFVCLLLSIFQEASTTTWITNADDITEEWLVSAGVETGYTEHVSHIKEVFASMKVRTFLEFGVGFSTKYFIENSEKVISVEFVTPGSGPEWLQYCIGLFAGFNNWMPIAYFSGAGLDSLWAPYKYMGAESVYRAAAYQPVHYQSYALIDPSFLDDLNRFVESLMADNEIDVAFVDAGVCIRGDLVQVLFDKVPVIVAHDIANKNTRHLNDVYGYGRIVIPENYVEIHVPFGMGTAFWVKNDEENQNVIKNLQAYVGRAAHAHQD